MIRVLLVDSDQAAGELATGLLVGEGDISVDIATSGQAALDRLLAAKYDAVVSEFTIPDLNGIDLLRRSREGGFSNAFIFLTDNHDERVALDAILNGADHYLHKTGNYSNDIALLRSILKKRQAFIVDEGERRAGQAYHSLLMRLGDGFAHHRIIYDGEGNPVSSMIIDANAAFERIISRPGDTVLGRDVRYLFKDSDDFERMLLDGFLEIALTSGEKRFQARSSLLDRWFSVLLYAPEPGHFFTVITDMTAQKAIEGGMRTPGGREPEADGSEGPTSGQMARIIREYEMILDSTPAMIIITDREGKMVKSNRAFIDKLGVRADSLPNVSFEEAYPKRWKAMRAEDLEIMRTGTPVLNAERQYFTMSGEVVWALVNKFPYRNERGETVGVITYAIDITKRREVEQELEQTRKKLHLVGSITRHDIMNKLAALHGYLALAQDKKDVASARRDLAKADAAAEQIRKMLEFSRAYEKVGAQRPDWLSAKEAANAGIAQVCPPEVNVWVELDGLELLSDRMIEKAFSNLADNAIRHGKASNIRIFTEKDGVGIRIIFQDDGSGVAPKARELLFDDRFGHGLYLVKEILNLTGMTIEETSPEKGARFEIKVPPGSYRFK